MLLVVLAIVAVVLAVAVLLYLSQGPFSTDTGQCHGGGETTYGLVVLGTAVGALVASIGTFVLAGTGRRSGRLGAAAVTLFVAGAALLVNLPDTSEINVGQC